MNVNLIPAARMARARVVRRKRAWWRFTRVYLVVAAVGAGAGFVPMYASGPSLSEDLARINKRIETATGKRDEQHKKITALTKLVDAARGVGEHPDWSLVLGALSRVREGDIVLESAELSIQKQEVAAKPGASAPAATPPNAPKPKPQETFLLKVSGISSTPGGALRYAHRIEELGVFERVSTKDTRAQALGRMPATHFEIEMFLPNPTGAN